jgi:hypothetical protein
MRDWMERHLSCRVLGLIDWPGYRLFGRCWTCNRLMILHTPWALFICERTNTAVEFTGKGEALLRQYEMEADLPDTRWQIEVGPAPQATA